jgi:hypothetical protein
MIRAQVANSGFNQRNPHRDPVGFVNLSESYNFSEKKFLPEVGFGDRA